MSSEKDKSEEEYPGEEIMGKLKNTGEKVNYNQEK